MDIHDCLKHPFKIECPATLIEVEQGDRWDFLFANGYLVLCVQYGDEWYVTVCPPKEKCYSTTMHDRDNAITELLERVAHLES